MVERKGQKKNRKESDASMHFGRLAELSTLVNDGLFIFDPASSCFKYMTQMVPEVLGRSKADLADCTDLISLFHEKDRDMISGAIERVMDEDDNISSDLIVRTLLPEEEYRWTRLKIHRITSPAKGGNFIGGSLSDIQTLRDAQMEAQFYLDIMTHDITNKHQVMLMNLEMLRYSGDLSPEKMVYLSSCVKQLGRAMDTIRSVKIMADVGIGPVETQPVDLQKAVRKGMEALENYHPYLRSRVDLNIPAGPVLVMGDERLALIIYHLISNSLTHNQSENPLVTISIIEEEGDARLEVSDNGPGVTRETIEEIKSLGPRDVSKAQGRGLGLSLITVLARAYDANFQLISGEDVEEDVGTRAVVTFKRNRKED